MFKSFKKILEEKPKNRMATIVEVNPPYNPLNEFPDETT
jgi:hypothetical protein